MVNIDKLSLLTWSFSNDVNHNCGFWDRGFYRIRKWGISMSIFRAISLIILTMLVSACAIKPPPRLSCKFRSFDLSVAEIAPAAANSAIARGLPPTPPDPYTDALRQSLVTGAVRAMAVPGSTNSFLSLSGGSLNGAYGAGYLDEWRSQSPGGRLPPFSTVTGISTGAILATFAFTNRTDAAVRGYTITREDQLLKPFVKPNKGKLGLGAYVKMLRRGSLGDLSPLRTRLNETIDDEMLRAVAAGAADGRLLLVGVVDVDTGEAKALDLTNMAERWAAAKDDRANLRLCYMDAIVASSSAPMAAAPVYIDNRMYIDGGARFGMFADRQVEAAALFRASPEGKAATAPENFLLINGDQRIKPRCAKADETLCTLNDPTGGEAAPAAWRLTDLALRSEQILANQVYRFSESQVARGGTVARVSKIDSSVDGHEYVLNDPVLGSGKHYCSEWAKLDVDLDDPVQFKPRYMRCLIDYGRARALAEQWWKPAQ